MLAILLSCNVMALETQPMNIAELNAENSVAKDAHTELRALQGEHKKLQDALKRMKDELNSLKARETVTEKKLEDAIRKLEFYFPFYKNLRRE